MDGVRDGWGEGSGRNDLMGRKENVRFCAKEHSLRPFLRQKF
jgi:hypothetical protein